MNTFQEYLEAAKEKKSKLNFNNSGDFIKYLHGTLVPDLRESGTDAYSDDFVEAMKHMRFPNEDTNDFINYLIKTLIPDLRESGSDAMADDYAEAVHWIKDNLKKQQFQHDEAKRTDRNIRDRETQEKKQKAKDKKNWG